MNKNFVIIAVAVGLAAAVVGCKKSDSEQVGTTPDTNTVAGNVTQAATNAWQDVKAGSQNAWEDIKESISSGTNYTYQEKDAFVTAANADLAALDARIQKLSDKAAAASDNAKADAQVKIQQLRDQRTALDQKLTDVKNSTDATWNDTKAAFISAYDDTKASVKAAWQSFKDKMS